MSTTFDLTALPKHILSNKITDATYAALQTYCRASGIAQWRVLEDALRAYLATRR